VASVVGATWVSEADWLSLVVCWVVLAWVVAELLCCVAVFVEVGACDGGCSLLVVVVVVVVVVAAVEWCVLPLPVSDAAFAALAVLLEALPAKEWAAASEITPVRANALTDSQRLRRLRRRTPASRRCSWLSIMSNRVPGTPKPELRSG
jgi:hypothetical protein